MPSIKLILQQPYERTKNGTRKPASKPTRLYAFIIIDRDHVIKCKTEHTIKPIEWDFETQGLKERLAGSIEFNKGLAELKSDIQSQYKKILKERPDITFRELSRMLKEYSKQKNKPVFSELSFFEYLEAYIKELEGSVTYRTIQKFNTLKRSLQEFVESNKKFYPLTFSQINRNFYRAYINHLRDQQPRGRQKRRPEGKQTGLLIDTQRKYIENLKAFCKWAENKNFNKFTAYRDFDTVSSADKKKVADKKNIITLTLPELTNFYHHDFSKRPSMDRVRDLFCFAAFTGQRWSDIAQFDKSQLKGNVWGFTAQKTAKKQEVDLTGFAAPALDILKKYDYQLPVISLQKFNDMLKDAGKDSGIDTPVELIRFVGVDRIVTHEPKYYFMSSHMARRTCVSILLNNFNIAPSLVMDLTAHTDLKTLQKYLNSDREARRDAIATKTKSVNDTMRVVKKKAV